jgi:2-polyprenyl-3-methyl-5-hydroxy-6-metoxy-1,4-benzoquinol methylase
MARSRIPIRTYISHSCTVTRTFPIYTTVIGIREVDLDGQQTALGTVYRTKATGAVSWYRSHLYTSLDLIVEAVPDRDAAIVDIGGGEATLVDDLLAKGYRQLSVLDISQAAIEVTKQRLGMQAVQVKWLSADVLKAPLPKRHYDLWHDRALFHFLTAAEQRAAYVDQLTQALKPGGHIVIATFSPHGPERCSGLEVVRYDAASLQRALGSRFELVESLLDLRHTPWNNTTQSFTYGHFRLT